MTLFDINKPSHVHFIGIGGASMSGLAEILLAKGFTVTGSDINPGKGCAPLEAKGIKIGYPQKAENITDDIDLVVYTAAIGDTNPELMEVRKRGIPEMTRAAFLGALSRNHSVSIAVSGTHGKTTTSSLISDICIAAGMDPTLSIGGVLESINDGMRIGNSEIFITEACEFTDSFLELSPKIATILNVEADHLDYFGDLENIRRSFKKFTDLIPADGTLVINSDIDDYANFAPSSGAAVVTYGTDPAKSDYYAADITFDAGGCGEYTLMIKGSEAGRIKLSVPGMHNVSNSLAAIAAAQAAGASIEDVRKGLCISTGARRRLEYKGEFNGVRVFDDYAHHPDEIAATLKAVRLMTENSIWAVFQPHNSSRTIAFLQEFADSMRENADHCILMEIYNDREADDSVSSADITRLINEAGGEAVFFDDMDKIAGYIAEAVAPGDVVITMGAGMIYNVAEKLTAKES